MTLIDQTSTGTPASPRLTGWARYDAERTAAAFAGRLRDQVELHPLRADRATVAGTLDPSRITAWLRDLGPAR